MKSPAITKVNDKALNNGKGAVAYNGKSAIPKAANLNDPYFESDADTMLYGNQDEVAQLIGRREFKDQWVRIVKGDAWRQWANTYWHHDLKAGGFDTTRKGIRTAVKRMWVWVKWMQQNADLSGEDQEELVKDARKADFAKRAKHYISDIYALISKDGNYTIEPGSFDTDHNLLGTPGGTVNLTIPDIIALLTRVTTSASRPSVYLLKLKMNRLGGFSSLMRYLQLIRKSSILFRPSVAMH